ncbi:MAG TPA: MFS transporter [Pyrinomonadaceae bacterium]|nr:MFS transporter [Pyrinomonadaceae bacterium]
MSADAQPRPAGARGEAPVNDRREVFGWMMYDWACSVFNTTVVTTLLGPYLTDLTQQAVGQNGVVFTLGPLPDITAESFFPLCVGLSVFLQVFLLPVLGAVADYSRLKKLMMAAFVYAAVVATCLLFFLTKNTYVLGGVLFVAANLCFGAAMVFYNSFLPEITTEDRRDRVSSRGFALGYLGGGLLLAANLALITAAPRLGIGTGLAVRLCLLSAGLWWGGFALFTFRRLRSRGAARSLPEGGSYLTVGFRELAGTFRELRRLPQTMRYLASYLFYNDGIQTVITMSAVLIEQELFKARGLEPDRAFLVGLILVIQFSAIAGALLFERAAALVGTKRAILVSLALWSGVVVYAYAFLRTTGQAWVLGAIIAVVLGGSQALSRSLFSRMIPRGREASFFSIYEISERGTSWIGPILFSLVISLTGSYRQAVLSLIVFFVVGMLGLFLTDTDRAIHDAGNRLPEEVSEETSAR